jgi:hypothetical protein
MSFERLTCAQIDVYERVWTRVMIASGVTLVTSLCGLYVFWDGRTKTLVFGIISVASLFVLSIAVAKLRELERGLNGSDREKRGEMHSALDSLDD